MRLFYAESISGVINWSLAAPLFAINAVMLAALLERSLAPIKALFSGPGLESLVELGVRVLRWGLWMAPIINTFLRQSGRPSWFNQDGAVRSLVAIGGDIGLSPADFRDLSLTMFIGLLAYDWLRMLIWFDHMGLRVATLVNLTFLGGDRVDEAAGRFLGHGARTRVIPDGIRRFATWAPLLIPYYIPRGADWDKAWTGAETLARGGPMPGAVKALAIAYGIAGAAISLAALVIAARAREKPGAPTLALAGAPAALSDLPHSFRVQQRRGRPRSHARRTRRGSCHGRRARRLSDRPHPPTARSAASARAFLLSQRRRRAAVVDRLRARASRGRISSRAGRLQSARHRQHVSRRARDHGGRARRRGRDS